MGALIVLVVIVPVLAAAVHMYGLVTALQYAGIGFAAIVAYLVALWATLAVVRFIQRLISYPIIRRLSKGVVPFRARRN